MEYTVPQFVGFLRAAEASELLAQRTQLHLMRAAQASDEGFRQVYEALGGQLNR